MGLSIKDFFGICFRIYLELLSKLIFGIKYYWAEPQPLPPIKNKIITESATEIARKIRTNKVTSEEVVNAFIERIKDVNPILNALVQDRFEDARKEAVEIDTYIRSSGKSEEELEEEKPLLGVPFTIKDFYAVKGLKHTCGMWARKDLVAEEDAECVRLMKEAGAINLGVTNVPELCMWWESSNTIYGRTNNAYDVNRMPGGSSGGEASLQCACGTPMSIGSDLGGSIRLPSFFNGVFGHKPTSDVVSNKGAEPNLIGLYDSYSVTGPLCKYAEDLSLMYKVLAGKNLNLLKLDKEVDLKYIKIYYMETDGGNPIVSRVSDEINYAQNKVLKHFEDEFKVSPVKVNLKELIDTRKIFFAKLGSEKGVKSLAYEFGNRKEEVSFFKEFFKWLIGKSEHTIFALFFIAYENFTKNQDNEKYFEMFDNLEKEVTELFGTDGVFIYPTQPKNDIYHTGTLFCPFNLVYTCIWNVLGFPSTQCPLGLGPNGLPLGVQVVANKHQDHLCLAVAKEIEKSFGGWVNPSIVTSESES